MRALSRRWICFPSHPALPGWLLCSWVLVDMAFNGSSGSLSFAKHWRLVESVIPGTGVS